jgi:hypothetical protein
MSVFFSWLLFSQDSELLVHLFAESCIMHRAVLATCLCHPFFPFLMLFPILHVLSKLHTWNIYFTTWLDNLHPTASAQLSTQCLMYCCSGPVIQRGRVLPLDCAASCVLHLCAVERYSVSHAAFNACLVYFTYVRHSLNAVTLQLSGKFVLTWWGLNDTKTWDHPYLSRVNISYVNKNCKVWDSLLGFCSA